MGLAGTKTRRKIGDDPNNTKWSRNENTFGQKILRAHGWTPGQYLGAEDAAHAEFHTNASSAPIKVILKDDTLGLGAKPRQKQSAECTGLNGFNDLLGRLNGKSEATIQKEQKVRSDIKTNLYIERRFGTVRFVSGGLLVGDHKEQPANEEEKEAEEPKQDKKEKKEKKDKKEKKSKKRKADDMNEDSTAVEATEDTDKEKSKKSKKKRSKKEEDDSDNEAEDDTSAKESEGKRSKKDKKSKEEKKSKKSKDKTKSGKSTDEKSERRKRKEEKRRKRLLAESGASDSPSTEQNSQSQSGVSTPSTAGVAARQPLSRHQVRARNIASKRLAMADMQALNQILMVKAV